MDGDKFAELQFQMRLNQNELQDFLKGMDSWEEDIKKRDEQLKKEDNRDGKVGTVLKYFHINAVSRKLVQH